MTSEATLVISSCPNNTPMIGLHQYHCTIGRDPARVFCIVAPLWNVESALAPYSYPLVLQHMYHKEIYFSFCFECAEYWVELGTISKNLVQNIGH